MKVFAMPNDQLVNHHDICGGVQNEAHHLEECKQGYYKREDF